MIRLFSGQPGHGKTVRALLEAMEFKKQGRVVYAEGIKDLDLDKTGFLPLDNPKDWEKLPDGAVVLVDECYRHFPNRSAQSRTPDYIEALARHRHRGFDFLLVCQDPAKQLDPFLRGLVDTHTHVRRKFGTHNVVLKTWDHFQSNPLASDGRNQVWRYPKEVFTWYTSATMHTVKRSIPVWMWFLIPLVGFVAYVAWHIKSGNFLNDAQAQPVAAAGGPASAGHTADASPLTTQQYIERNQPRIPGQPWTAPVFDERKPLANPEVYCISSAVKCTCLTEQGTTYRLSMKVCRDIARHGNYNPYRQPIDTGDRQPDADQEPVEDLAEDLVGPAGAPGEPGSVGSPHQGEIWGKAPETIRAATE
jgi:zona occludens toxin